MSNEKKSFNWKAITQHRLFLPIVCLLVVLLVNVIKTPNFFAVSIKNGVLYGYLVRISVLVQLWRWPQQFVVRSYPVVRYQPMS